MIVDLQIDVANADGERLEPEALVTGAKAAGLDAVVLTDGPDFELDVTAYREAAVDAGLTVLRGAKVESNHGLLLCILPEGVGAPAEGWSEQEEGLYDAHAVIDAVEAVGGISVALRPYDRDVAHPMGDHVFSLQGLTACEVMTGGLSDIANDLALEAASNMEMPCVGTSGNHGVEGFGTAATLLRRAVDNETELCEAIRTGDCWPVTFADEAPKPEPAQESRGRGRGGRGGRSGGGGGRDRDRDRGDRGDREGGREGRGGRGRGGRGRGGRNRGGRGGGGSDDRGNRKRGGRGRGPKPDDFGNRAPSAPKHVDEDIGNRVRNDEERRLAEDIGNRLKPGEASPYRSGNVAEPTHDDVDDGIGNR